VSCAYQPSPFSIVVIVVLDHLAFPNFAPFVDGEECNDVAGERVEPGGAGQGEEAEAEQGGDAE